MRELAYPLAVTLVVAAPVLLVGTLALLATWARWILRSGDPAGRAGLWVTYACGAGAAIWLSVDGERSLRSTLARAQVAGLVGLATSLVVVVRVRRSGRGSVASAPAARRP